MSEKNTSFDSQQQTIQQQNFKKDAKTRPMNIADKIHRMVEFLTDNVFVMFGGFLFRQVSGIPEGTHCAPFPANIFPYSYESELF